MVKIGEYEVKEDCYYIKEHFWAHVEGGLVKFGATDYGQKALKEVVFIELPEVGTEVTQGQPYGSVESVKAVVDLIALVSGTVEKINENLKDNPEPINKDPYVTGWMIAVKPSNLNADLKKIMDFKAAVEFYKTFMKK